MYLYFFFIYSGGGCYSFSDRSDPIPDRRPVPAACQATGPAAPSPRAAGDARAHQWTETFHTPPSFWPRPLFCPHPPLTCLPHFFLLKSLGSQFGLFVRRLEFQLGAMSLRFPRDSFVPTSTSFLLDDTPADSLLLLLRALGLLALRENHPGTGGGGVAGPDGPPKSQTDRPTKPVSGLPVQHAPSPPCGQTVV